MPIEILGVVRDQKSRLPGLHFERVRQTKIAKLKVVPIGLAIRSDVHEISEPRCGEKLLHQPFARRECPLKSNRAHEWSIVEEDCQRPTRSIRMSKQVRFRSIDLTFRLIRRKDDVTHALLYQQRKHLIVGSSLRQPERLRFTTETKAKVR